MPQSYQPISCRHFSQAPPFEDFKISASHREMMGIGDLQRKIETKMEESKTGKMKRTSSLFPRRRRERGKKLLNLNPAAAIRILRHLRWCDAFSQGQGNGGGAEGRGAGAERVLHFALIGRILKGDGLWVQRNYKSCHQGRSKVDREKSLKL